MGSGKVEEIVPADVARVQTDSAMDTEKLVDTNHTDAGLALFEESLGMDSELRDRLAKRIKRKLDFGLLPVVSVPILDRPEQIF